MEAGYGDIFEIPVASLASTTGFGVLGPFFDIESLFFYFISIRKAFCGKGSAKKQGRSEVT